MGTCQPYSASCQGSAGMRIAHMLKMSSWPLHRGSTSTSGEKDT